MITLTKGTVTIAPMLMLGFTSARESRSVISRVIGRELPDATLRPMGNRTGSFRLLFADAGTSWQAEQALRIPGLWTLTDTDLPTANMRFVPGDITRTLDPDTRLRWLVSLNFEEL